MNSKASAAAESCQGELSLNSENVFTEGSIGKAVWQMAWPLLLTSTLSSLIGLVDMYLAGFLGDAAQAAIGIGEQFIFFAVTIGTGLCIGCQALISRCAGARELRLLRLYVKDSLYAGGLFGLLATIVGILFAKDIFACFAVETAVNDLGVRYLQLTSLGNLPFMLAMVLTAVFRAAGVPRYALYVWSVITVVSIVSAFAFVFSPMPWGFMSVDSLAWSWNLGATIGVVCGMVLVARLQSGNADRFCFADYLPSSQRIREILAVGIPATIADLSWVVSNFLLFMIFANLPDATAAQAAWSVAYKLEETVASYPLLALSLAAASVVGQNLGAGKTARAYKAALLMALSAAVVMFVVGCLLTVLSVPLVSLFSRDELVVHYGQMLLSASPILLPLLALWLVFFGAVEGAGVTAVPMVFNAAGYLLVRLPLAWLLAMPAGLGMNGVFIALFVSRLLLSLIAGMIFLKRQWLKTGLLEQAS